MDKIITILNNINSIYNKKKLIQPQMNIIFSDKIIEFASSDTNLLCLYNALRLLFISIYIIRPDAQFTEFESLLYKTHNNIDYDNIKLLFNYISSDEFFKKHKIFDYCSNPFNVLKLILYKLIDDNQSLINIYCIVRKSVLCPKCNITYLPQNVLISNITRTEDVQKNFQFICNYLRTCHKCNILTFDLDYPCYLNIISDKSNYDYKINKILHYDKIDYQLILVLSYPLSDEIYTENNYTIYYLRNENWYCTDEKNNVKKINENDIFLDNYFNIRKEIYILGVQYQNIIKCIY